MSRTAGSARSSNPGAARKRTGRIYLGIRFVFALAFVTVGAGRLDPSAREGTWGFRLLILNGLTSEATHIYDPAISLGEAWRTLFAQWDLAFEIAAENRRRGARPATWREILRRVAGWLDDPLRSA